jgi:uncharacterized membrane protein HdeD (DUF308 family)
MAVTTPAAGLFEDVRSYGTVLIIAGIVGVVAGVLALVFPDVTLLALALIAGINLLLLGALSLVDSFGGDRDSTSRVLSAVIGVLGIIAGLVVMRRPGESLLALVLVIGIWLVVTGIVDFVRALATLENRALRMLGALIDVVLGAVILAWPDLGLGTLAFLVGLSFVIRGLVAIARGFFLRRAVTAAPAGAVPA